MSLSGSLPLVTNMAGVAGSEASSALQPGTALQGTADNPFEGLLQNHLLLLMPPADGVLPTELSEDLSASATETSMELPAGGNSLPPQTTPIAWSMLLLSDNGNIPQALPLTTPALATPTTTAATLTGSSDLSIDGVKPLSSPLAPGIDLESLNAESKLADLLRVHADSNGAEDLLPVRQSDLPASLSTGSAATLAVAGDDSDSGAMSPRANLASNPIPVPPRHPEWGHALGERLQWVVGEQLQKAEIRLDPPELGALEVKIVMHKDSAQIHFSSPYAQVREAVEDAIPRLREMLDQVGVALGDVNVSQESFRQDMSQEQEPRAGTPSENSSEEDLEGTAGSLPAAAIRGLLDTYA